MLNEKNRCLESEKDFILHESLCTDDSFSFGDTCYLSAKNLKPDDMVDCPWMDKMWKFMTNPY